VQARAIAYQFRRPDGALAAGTATPATGTHDTIIVYDDPTTTPPTLATSWAPQRSPANCGQFGAEVDFGELTTLLPAPVVVFYATNGGADWTPVVSPGLAVGQIAGGGCWTAPGVVVIGAGAAGATTAARFYQPTSFTGVRSYQLLLTDDRAIMIDDLDVVSYLPRLLAWPTDAGADARD
jgi:hypothetical protein